MASVEFGDKVVEFRCTSWTMEVYETEFLEDKNERVTGDLIKDAMGKLVVNPDDAGFRLNESGEIEVVIFNYTHTDWNVLRRVFWAMLKTQDDILTDDNVPHEPVPSYKQWVKSTRTVEPDLRLVSEAVGNELQRGLFRTGAAASRKTSE